MSAEDTATRYHDPLLGVVFDLDGTLVLSQHDFVRMRREVIRIAERHGVIPGHLHPTEPIHQILEAARAELARGQVPEGQVFRFEAEVNARIDAIEMEALPRTVVRPGAPELLTRLTERGFRIGVLTRSSEEFCRSALKQTGLLEFLPYLRTRSAPGPAKPSPEALLGLLDEMGVPPDRAAFVGDHLIDAECATRARIRFYGILPAVAVPDGITPERFRAAGAREVVSDLAELAHLVGVPLAPA
ncbi:MAG: HAD family hydrolase [Thermoplasmata archaeon]|nr:HAD family hydrolase [Thermoplasmata archaeon]